MLREHPYALVAVEERGVGYRVNRPFPDGELSGDMIITDVADLVADHVSRVIIRDPEATADDFVGSGHGSACTAPTTSSAGPRGSTSPRSASPRPPGSRGAPTHSGSPQADALAIGDGRNDIEMLRWAGRGVAMGQAVQEVQEAADAVTGTVYDDGVVDRAGPLVPGGERRRTPSPRPLWRWPARKDTADPSAWCFVTVPLGVSQELRQRAGEPRGFGSVPVPVQAGGIRVGTPACSPTRELGVLRAPDQEGGAGCPSVSRKATTCTVSLEPRGTASDAAHADRPPSGSG